MCICHSSFSCCKKPAYKETDSSGYKRGTKKNESAAIIGGELVLKSGESEIRFDISTIHNLESKDGKTSFTYLDKERGVTNFSCLDYYTPQIAKLLYDKGIR